MLSLCKLHFEHLYLTHWIKVRATNMSEEELIKAQQEAEVLRKMAHSNIISCVESFVTAGDRDGEMGKYCIVTEFADRKTYFFHTILTQKHMIYDMFHFHSAQCFNLCVCVLFVFSFVLIFLRLYMSNCGCYNSNNTLLSLYISIISFCV